MSCLLSMILILFFRFMVFLKECVIWRVVKLSFFFYFFILLMSFFFVCMLRLVKGLFKRRSLGLIVRVFVIVIFCILLLFRVFGFFLRRWEMLRIFESFFYFLFNFGFWNFLYF